MKIFILYYDYGGDEGCSSPEGITMNEAEVDTWMAEDELGQRAYSEFQIEIE